MKFLKIQGYASYYNVVDYHNDLIKPGAFTKSMDLFKKNKTFRLLANHNNTQPIAKISNITELNNGLYIEASIPNNSWNEQINYQIENDLLGDLSIGIIPIKFYWDKNIRIITEAQLLEISVVTIGANPYCKIHHIETIMI